MNGANVSAVARPYSARATRCRVTITPDTGQAHEAGPGRLSGRHLLDQPYRQTPIQARMIDLQQESRRRALARVDDHHDRAHLFRGGPRVALCRFEHLEDIAERDAIAATLVDEEELLRAGDRMRVSRVQQPARQTLLDGRGPHLTRIAERLE